MCVESELWEKGGCVCRALMQQSRPDSSVYVPSALKSGDEAQGTNSGGHQVPPSARAHTHIHTHRSEIKAAKLTHFSRTGSRRKYCPEGAALVRGRGPAP